MASPTWSWSISSRTRCLVKTCLLICSRMQAQQLAYGQDHSSAISGEFTPLTQ
jgi:hypothetical protein